MRGRDFYLGNGFKEGEKSHTYLAMRPQKKIPISESPEALKEKHRKTFLDLHNSHFPRAYRTAKAIFDGIDDNHKVFVCTNKNEVIAYIYGTIEDNSEKGEIEFFAVNPEFRRKGIGKRLLLNALNWFFEVKKIPSVGLCVSDELTNARSLYQGVGFRHEYTGMVFNKKVGN